LIKNEAGYQMRTIGEGERLDGLADLLNRGEGASVFDVGCNAGVAAYEFIRFKATIAHGCDIFEPGIEAINRMVAEKRSVNSCFKVVDLTGGGAAIERAFGDKLLRRYDIILLLAIYHKLARVMKQQALDDLVRWLGNHCGTFFAWKGSKAEMEPIGAVLTDFHWIHYSEISLQMHDGKLTPQPCAIWKRH
jgi:SAM-dependent methyltransferase